ncbi:NINE protein, partial [Hymenobacter coccineus]|uniref:NINE protein n=1 Tax=Hymenobacter coccineus TaxID=1908235 RepID=UPI000F7AFC17
ARRSAAAGPAAARPQARTRFNRAQRLAGRAQGELPRQRSRGVALVLALLFGGLGLHLFYLGYYGRGTLYLMLTLVGVLLFSVGTIGLFATILGGSSSGLVGLLIAGGILAGIAGVLALIDAVLIATGALQPKNGEYKSRLF